MCGGAQGYARQLTVAFTPWKVAGDGTLGSRVARHGTRGSFCSGMGAVGRLILNYHGLELFGRLTDVI